MKKRPCRTAAALDVGLEVQRKAAHDLVTQQLFSAYPGDEAVHGGASQSMPRLFARHCFCALRMVFSFPGCNPERGIKKKGPYALSGIRPSLYLLPIHSVSGNRLSFDSVQFQILFCWVILVGNFFERLHAGFNFSPLFIFRIFIGPYDCFYCSVNNSSKNTICQGMVYVFFCYDVLF